MLILVIATLACVAIGGVVVGFVAVEARRDGRDMLTPEGEQLMASVKKRGDEMRERGDQIRRRTVASVRQRGGS
ncbi:MAG: hypothetical protein M3520_04830 [Actinomycetota bacterium]|jgi:hypothetical protein|nr:hypothetical protein [Actinomycetota bacterium]